MKLTPFVVGCDVSKAKIDFFDASNSKHTIVANQTGALNRFLAPYAGCDVRFAYEATGFYGNELRAALVRHQCAGVQINPLHGRRFAQSLGRLAKTDRIDATQLATMAERLELPQTYVWNEDVEQLKALITRRDQLVAMRANERKRLQQTRREPVRESHIKLITMLSGEIASLDEQINQTIKANDEMQRNCQLLQSIPGIGPTIAPVLIAMLPETGTMNRSTIAALAGVAPIARDSGTFTAKRSIAGGRARIRKALYQAAMGTLAGTSRFKQKYLTMIQKGKPPKVALIAIARKILTTANAVLKTQKQYI